MTKIKVRREQILGTSDGRENETIKTFADSEIKEDRIFKFNFKSGVITTGTLKINGMIYNQKRGKITAHFRILEIA